MIERGVHILGGVELRDLLEDEYTKLCDAPVNEIFRTFKRVDVFFLITSYMPCTTTK